MNDKRWWSMRWIVLALLGIMLAGCAVNPVTGKRELALIPVPESQEIELGQASYPQVIQQMGGSYPDPQLNEYVDTVGKRLARYSHRPDLPYQFTVINDSTPNAFALPGGPVAITRGLLTVMENEAQLASVLGHEIAHVTARHSVQGIQRGVLLELGVGVLGSLTSQTAYGGLTSQAGQIAASLINNTYSREQERESDRLGIDYMVRAGYNPQGAVELQELFYRKLEGGAEPDWLSGLFRTHPFSKERMLENQQYIQANYPPSRIGSDMQTNATAFMQATAGLREKKKAYDLYDEARQLEAQEQYQKAIELYQQALRIAPQESLILTGVGLASLKIGDTIPAQRYLRQAVDLHGEYFQSRMGLGFVLLEKREPAAAVEHLEYSMKLLPTPQAGYLLAQAYEGVGRRNDALALYQEVAQAAPDSKIGQAAAQRAQQLQSAR